MKYNINDVENLLDSEIIEKFPIKKGPKKMKKHQENDEKKKERHVQRFIKNLTYILSEEDQD